MLKSILVPLERVTARAVLDTTVLLAKRFGSYVEGFAAPEVNSELIGLEAVAFSARPMRP